MDDFHTLTATIERLLHIRCGNYKEDYIKRRLSSRMNAVSIKEYLVYNKYLLSNPEEQEKLRNALTINVTKFFRDKEVFEIVKRELIPEILKKKQRVRIWSAGCSSGEEPYSYAIVLYEIGLTNPTMDALIIASDIDYEILKRAKAGVYERPALDNMTELQIKKHFTLQPDGKYEIKPHIREKVRFQYHDLMRGEPVAKYLDLISCRNVTIYFNEQQKNDLCKEFHNGLVVGGYYVMGLSEYLGKEMEPLFRPYRPLLKIFVRQ